MSGRQMLLLWAASPCPATGGAPAPAMSGSLAQTSAGLAPCQRHGVSVVKASSCMVQLIGVGRRMAHTRCARWCHRQVSFKVED